MRLHASPSLAGLALSALLATGCEVPPVAPTADPRQSERSSRIEGTLVVSGPDRGNAVVLLYDAARPPPPQGTGRPVSFTVVKREQLFGAYASSRGFVGPFTAPFTLSLVPPGRYLLRALLDVDTCLRGESPCHGSDFSPWYSVTSEANAGDVGGAAVDLAANPPVPLVVEVPQGAGDAPLPVTGVTVSIALSATNPALPDRPAFRVTGSEVVNNSATLEPTRSPNSPLLLTLESLHIEDVPAERIRVQSPTFRLGYVDANRTDLWPRVVVRKLAAEGSLADDTDANDDGTPDLVVLGAQWVLTPEQQAQLAAAQEPQPNPQPPRNPTAYIEVSSLRLAVVATAFDAINPANRVTLSSVPPGRYSLTVLQRGTGQSWRVPNELSAPYAEQYGLPEISSQSFTIEVPASGP